MNELITPVVLTHEEEANLGRCLDSLRWAARVIVVDSGSRDATEQIARSYPNVVWTVRHFDRHALQWEYGINHPEVRTDYVLALDADMAVPDPTLREIQEVVSEGLDGAVLGFDYCYAGQRLLGSVYPPQLRLFRRSVVRVTQPGHTQVFSAAGRVRRLRSRLVHDDRKPLRRWLNAQAGYARLEADRMATGAVGVKDLLRRAGLAAPLVGMSAYLRAGGPLSGRASIRYACERALFECLLCIALSRGDERGQTGRA